MEGDTLAFAQVMTVIVLSAGGLATIALGSWAFVRRITRRPERSLRPATDDARLERLENAVEAIAIEVERISEGQRFTVTLLAERLPARPETPGLPAASPRAREEAR